MPVKLSPGKWQRLRSLTDEQGRFKMLAIDQRDSLRRALARAIGQEPREVTAADLTKAKAIVTKVLWRRTAATRRATLARSPTSSFAAPPSLANRLTVSIFSNSNSPPISSGPRSFPAVPSIARSARPSIALVRSVPSVASSMRRLRCRG
jgi:hypothetical protein